MYLPDFLQLTFKHEDTTWISFEKLLDFIRRNKTSEERENVNKNLLNKSRLFPCLLFFVLVISIHVCFKLDRWEAVPALPKDKLYQELPGVTREATPVSFLQYSALVMISGGE